MKAQMKKTIILSMIGIFTTLLIVGLVIAKDYRTQAMVENTITEPKTQLNLISNVPDPKEEITIKKNIGSLKKIVATPVATKKDTTAPVISASELTITQGDIIHVLENVTAIDNVDGDLSSEIKVLNTVTSDTIGEYSADLMVTDKSGNTASTKRIIHVVAPAIEPVMQPTPVEQPVVQEEPVVSETPPVESVVPVTSVIEGMSINFAGQTIAYQNAGQGSAQSIIDSNPAGTAATWGGAATQSGTDGLNTHFIAHNPGAFSGLFSLEIGSQIVVTDANGTPSTYTVQNILHLDDYGISIDDGQNYWDNCIGTAGGERITLQTCINDSVNLMVFAYA